MTALEFSTDLSKSGRADGIGCEGESARRGIGALLLSAASFRHPRDVLDNGWLSPARKREVLAHWASDINAVADRPALRRLENGAIASIDELLGALKSLDRTFDGGRASPASRRHDPKRPRLLSRLRRGAKGFRRRDDDDDDPPPAPVATALPRPPEFSVIRAAGIGAA